MMSLSETTNKKRKIPEGYKQTAVGIIPEEWDVTTLGNAVKFLDGKRKPLKESDRANMPGQYPYYGASGIIDYVNDYIFDEALILLGEDGANIVNRSTPLAFKVSGKIWVNNHAHVLKPSEIFEIGYLVEFLESIKYDKYNTGTAQPKLNKDICTRIPLPLPPLPEQQKIAAILTTWDEAIEKTQKLIDQLKQRNKGLAQQLLTGKKRLKGFSGEWRTLHIYQIAKPVNILNKDGLELEVLSCTKYDGLVRSMDYFGRRVYGEDLSKYKVVPKGTFAYATNHIEEGSIGLQNLVEKGLISPMYTVFKTDASINDGFLFRLLKTERMIYAYQSNMSGSINRRGGLRWSEFSTILVKIPTIKEQVAIHACLSQADQELTLYKKKLKALLEQKKGLMQKLLTGEIRVKTS